MEGMFNDIRISTELTTEFKDKLTRTEVRLFDFILSHFKRSLPMEISVNVLTSTFWPVSQSASCQMPDDFQVVANDFAQYYMNRHSGRKLTWNFNMVHHRR
jgi:cullin 3